MKFLSKFVSAKKSISAFAMLAIISAFSAISAFAANPDLDTATTSLTTGITDMKTNALVIIAACILVIVVVFGIGWLINIVKRNMSKA
jgi:putative Mn2+ efflux pump MntP